MIGTAGVPVSCQSCLGSFRFTLTKIPFPNLSYEATQSVSVTVTQDQIILYQHVISGIGTNGLPCDLTFAYANLVDPVCLVIESAINNNQFNLDNPIQITHLVLDDLFGISFLNHSMELWQNDEVIDQGNVLYCTGKLRLTLGLPMITNCRIEPV